jgi:hypothetical protein
MRHAISFTKGCHGDTHFSLYSGKAFSDAASFFYFTIARMVLFPVSET